MGKVGGVALGDARGIPRGPCAGPSDPPAVPQNATWKPSTGTEGLRVHARPPHTHTEVEPVPALCSVVSDPTLVSPPLHPTQAQAFTSAASVCSSLPQSGSSGQKCAPCTPAARSASWEETRQPSVMFSGCVPRRSCVGLLPLPLEVSARLVGQSPL